MTEVAISLLPHAHDFEVPKYATAHAAGMDLQAAIPESITLQPGKRALVATGISIALPPGFEAQIRPRSGLAAKYGITVLNTPGTVDADYRGEIKVILINLGEEPFQIEPRMRIAQMIVAAHECVTWKIFNTLSETQRGSGGFGSTGTKC